MYFVIDRVFGAHCLELIRLRDSIPDIKERENFRGKNPADEVVRAFG
jgi:hypothetical protein